MNKFFQSKAFKVIIIVIGVLIVLMLVFKLGMVIGSGKERFLRRWSENYPCNFFGGPPGGFPRPRDFAGPNFNNEIKAYGVFGKIIKIELPTLVIKGEKDVEKIVLLKDDTIIERFREKISSKELKVDDNVVIIGSPNEQGQIEAKMIRVMP